MRGQEAKISVKHMYMCISLDNRNAPTTSHLTTAMKKTLPRHLHFLQAQKALFLDQYLEVARGLVAIGAR